MDDMNAEGVLCASRPAKIIAGDIELDAEFRNARWTHHRLLDIEDEHQTFVDRTAEECAPGIVRCGRLVAKLRKRVKRRERTRPGQWSPDPRPELAAVLGKRLAELREQRNADEDWKEALRWFDLPEDDAPERGAARRKSSETDEEYAARCASRRTKLTRREQRQAALYETRKIHWSTWNALVRTVAQARAAVLKLRKAGLPAEWRRRRWDDDNTITAEPGCWRIVELGKPWCTLQLRLLNGWVTFRAKLGNWHEFDPKNIKRIQLTRRKSGRSWVYSVTAAVVRVSKGDRGFATSGLVALDWGHREHGHPSATEGIRVFAWMGDDGEKGEILLPRECRDLADKIDSTKARMDLTWNARAATLGIPKSMGRHGYQRELTRRGVLTEEEAAWIAWETRYERRLSSMRDRIENLRRETYLKSVQMLRRRYAIFALESETTKSHRRRAIEEMEPRRMRSNRELSARYAFTEICERFGATPLLVPSRNSTRECPDCGILSDNGPDLIIVCAGCGRARDKDFGACRVILRRAQEALANQRASA